MQAHVQPVPRDPVPQVAYKSARRQKQFTGSEVIEFVVDGEEGIRLSDALKGNGGRVRRSGLYVLVWRRWPSSDPH